MRILLPVLAPLALLTGCAASGGAGDTAATSGQTDGPAQGDHDLLVVVDLGDGTAPERWTLTCAGTASGTHPDADAACTHLKGLADPFAPLPADAVCTQVYGGPETARVSGVWQGEPVELELSRTDGCRIAQWDDLGPLLPPPAGVAPPSVAPPS